MKAMHHGPPGQAPSAAAPVLAGGQASNVQVKGPRYAVPVSGASDLNRLLGVDALKEASHTPLR